MAVKRGAYGVQPTGCDAIHRGESYTEPYKTLNREMQRRTSKKFLGSRAYSWQDAGRVLSGVARQLASYTEPNYT